MRNLVTNEKKNLENALFEAILHAQPHPSIAIIGHEKPDGDCVGSCVAMELYIKSIIGIMPIPEEMKGEVIDVILDPVYKNVERVIPGACGRVPQHEGPYDIAIAVDVNIGRMGDNGNKAFESAKFKMMIDHHATNTGEGADKYWIRPGLSSCCELIYWLIAEDTSSDFPAMCAKELYVGMLTDSGNFRFPSTTPDTFIAASKLIACGIDFPEITRQLFFERDFVSMETVSQAVLNAKLEAEGKVITSILTYDQLQQFGADTNSIGRVPNELLACDSAVVSIFFTEFAPGEYVGSFRSKSDDINVSDCAQLLGGGGHKAAAGCKFKSTDIEKTMAEAVTSVTNQF